MSNCMSTRITPHKICVVSATRAEYGLLKPLMCLLQEADEFELQLLISGTHLAPQYGNTWQTVVDDGFQIDEQIEMLVAGDSPSSVTKSLSVLMMGLADALRRLTPDVLVILGDRYEMLAVALSATLFGIPLVHIHGGEQTKGAIDDSIRHAITKLSHVHFASTETYRQRIIQMGEVPTRVFNVGAIGIDNIQGANLLSRAQLAESLSLDLNVPYFLVTYHPVTLDGVGDAVQQMNDVLRALVSIDGTQAIITYANADVGGWGINECIESWVAQYPDRLHAFTSLGQLRYLSAMKYTLGVVGNSSSGIVEAPSMQVPTLNIGSRQEGRIAAESVLHVPCTLTAITEGLRQIAQPDAQTCARSVVNPYGNGGVSQKILASLTSVMADGLGVQKEFFDVVVDDSKGGSDVA